MIFYQLSVHEYVHMSVAPYKTTSKTNIYTTTIIIKVLGCFYLGLESMKFIS